jgi:hypothetical protein
MQVRTETHRIPRTLLVFKAIWVVLVIVASARAEVLELEGVVKAIDASARTITIERKTPKGTKTLELELAEKAGDFSAVTVGDKISFSYDPGLELVTKLGKEDRAVKRSEDRRAIRVRIAVSDTGEASVEVEPIQIASEVGKSGRDNLGDGAWRLTNYFVTPKDARLFESPFGKPVNAEVDPTKKTLVFSPRKSPGFENPSAQCVYPVRLRVPFEIEVDVSTTAKEGWPFLQVYAMPRDKGMERPVFNFRTKSALEDGLVFEAWSGKMGVKEGGSHVVEETQIDLNGKWSKTFRLPVPNMKSQDFYTVTIGSLGPPSDKTFIHRIIVSGFPVPLLGMQLDRNGDVIYVKAVNPGMAAAKSGVREGDVILAIDRTKPSSLVNALELLANNGFGKACELTVKRGDEDRRFELKPEWSE